MQYNRNSRIKSDMAIPSSYFLNELSVNNNALFYQYTTAPTNLFSTGIDVLCYLKHDHESSKKTSMTVNHQINPEE